jgi:hypothetical protein
MEEEEEEERGEYGRASWERGATMMIRIGIDDDLLACKRTTSEMNPVWLSRSRRKPSIDRFVLASDTAWSHVSQESEVACDRET